MHLDPVLIYHCPASRTVPVVIRAFAGDNGLRIVRPLSGSVVLDLVNRAAAGCIVLDDHADSPTLCSTLKADSFTGIVPVVFNLRNSRPATIAACFQAGADEVLTPTMSPRERALRLKTTLQRAARDVAVHPTTRLPGTAQIQRDIGERTRRGEIFAVCYADLDHFKEFNDRYGYNHGDRVISLLARILRDVVRAMAPGGFIGHIGGDDFIFNVPVEHMPACCELILEIFDSLIPYQYQEDDRRAGYFLGNDRRGNTFRVPIMSLSIGVVTNLRRRFTHTARVGELATEMKAYAKTLPGSVYAVDRRSDASRRASSRFSAQIVTQPVEAVGAAETIEGLERAPSVETAPPQP
jgi:GGDEF domain-containing protein